MKRRLGSALRGLAVLITSLGMASNAMAGAFGLTEQSASGLGAAFAGAAAIAEDPTTIYFNPAGMSRLEGTQVTGGVHYIRPTNRYYDHDSTLNPAFAGPDVQMPPGPTSDSPSEDGWVPNLYFSHKFDDHWAIGLGVNAPFGLSTKYKNNWVGRYAAVESEIKTININPSISYRFSEHWSVGAGMSAQYMRAKLTQKVDSTLFCWDNAGPTTCTVGLGLGASGIGNPDLDSSAKITANNWAYGWNAGILWELSEATRFGVSYRSKVKQQLDGDARFQWTSALLPLTGASNSKFGAGADIKLPASASLSWVHRSGPLTLLADVTWVQWSNIEKLAIKIPKGNSPTPLDLKWDDTYRTSVGIHFRATERLILRAGYAYDETPTPNKQHRTPRLPDEDRRWLTIGCGYTLSEAITFDLGYAHLFIRDAKIEWEDPFGNTINGEYVNGATDIASAQVTYRF